MKAPITFAIAGFGDRGSTYASMQKLFPDRMKVVAVADINPEKVQKAKELYDIKDELCGQTYIPLKDRHYDTKSVL